MNGWYEVHKCRWLLTGLGNIFEQYEEIIGSTGCQIVHFCIYSFTTTKYHQNAGRIFVSTLFLVKFHDFNWLMPTPLVVSKRCQTSDTCGQRCIATCTLTLKYFLQNSVLTNSVPLNEWAINIYRYFLLHRGLASFYCISKKPILLRVLISLKCLQMIISAKTSLVKIPASTRLVIAVN